MSKYNDINSKEWREYDDILTDSLWMIDKRDNSGVHSAKYHGNFVPQIPYQMLNRYTKKGDWILDPFLGLGTTLIEAQRLGRNGIGIELQSSVAKEALNLIKSEPSNGCTQIVKNGNSATVQIDKILSKQNIEKVQFVIFHPPYWDIIKFSDSKDDLSNSPSLNDFLNAFGKIIDNTTKYLEKDRYCAVVIGDKYANGETIPLGNYCMNLFLDRGFKLKGIIVKNFEETKGKSNAKSIWRYRALTNDFYIFKHEYIYVFKKVKL